MTKKYMLFSLEDPRTKSIAEILGNKTSSKIINFLTEKEEASQKDISDALRIPMNTVEYNIKKMARAGVVEESKNFFWSPKGKKIKMYRFSNKSIVISPKTTELSSQIKNILPVALLSGIAAVGLRYYFSTQQTADSIAQDASLFATKEMAASAGEATATVINTGNYWLWFLIGALFTIALLVVKIILYEKSWQPFTGESKK